MPIYEYGCKDCGSVEEHLMRLTDPPPRQCAKCHGNHMEKLLSQTSFALKGSGWYVTDYKPKAGGSGDAKGESEGGAAEAPAAGTSDAPAGPAGSPAGSPASPATAPAASGVGASPAASPAASASGSATPAKPKTSATGD